MELVKELLAELKAKNPEEPLFQQTVEEVAVSLAPLFEQKPEYVKVFRVMCEPERVVMFRVPWVDDEGKHHIQKGYRVQFNSAIGPYKGGLRFHKSVNLDILKSLAFEQTLKNALTTLPMGGGKGGSDFDPHGKSNAEVARFCQSFMSELFRHIGSHTDTPAGDIGVGGREIGYMYGQYRRLTNYHQHALTGKGVNWGGSLCRTEATGWGLVYMCDNYIKDHKESWADKRVVVSGSGNVALYATQKVLALGGKVITMSDSSGCVYEPEGFTEEQLEHMRYLKEVKRARIKEYCDFSPTAIFYDHPRYLWTIPCDVALPCATQHEIELDDAKALLEGKCKLVAEGSNIASTNEAITLLKENGVAFLPAKAANAGGVAVSGLEMSQNSMRIQWPKEKVDEELQCIMTNIYEQCKSCSGETGEDYQTGANVSGFLKVAKSMIDQGDVFI
jgi:glutamate dehydrogenase/leucine dehydrogenase